MNPLKNISHQSYLYSIAAGLVYGIIVRGLWVWKWDSVAISIMSWSFLFIVPAVMGFLTISTMRQPNESFLNALFLPWIPVLAGMVFTLLVAWEGSICAIFYVPMALIMATFGGFLAWVFGKTGVSSKTLSLAVLVVPFMTHPLEKMQSPTSQFKKVHSTIEISADETAVWNQIKSVPKIMNSEMQDS